MITPKRFRFQDQSRYPVDNYEDFEYFLSNNMPDQIGEYTWLPVTWTAYYKTCKYGADVEGLSQLQQYLNALPRDKKYATCIQWDDGLLNNVSHLNLRVYGMGCAGDYQLPLICQPHTYQGAYTKDIFCSFVGRITHPIRQQIVDQLKGKPGYFIQTHSMRLSQFCEVLSRSKYVLAPRGYGATSFRICETLQYGAVPIYLSDTFLRPHNKQWSGIIEVSDLDNIDDLPREYNQRKIQQLYHDYFTYESCKRLIIEDLKNIKQ